MSTSSKYATLVFSLVVASTVRAEEPAASVAAEMGVAKPKALSSKIQTSVSAELRRDTGSSPWFCLVHFGATLTNISDADLAVHGMRLTGRLEAPFPNAKPILIPPKVSTSHEILFDDLQDAGIAHRWERAILGKDEPASFWRVVALPYLSSSAFVVLNGSVAIGPANEKRDEMVCSASGVMGLCRPKDRKGEKDECASRCEPLKFDAQHGARLTHAVVLLPECRVFAAE